jgi:phospholipase/carboxylesterase
MLDVIEIEPPKKAIGSVIWLHGLGASGDDFSPIVPHMQLQDVRFIFPHAPIRSVTINGGMKMRAWYDITTLEETSEREKLEDILEAEQQIKELIEREIERGIPSQHIVLMGFSQGAAMALQVGHRYDKKLLGVVVMSGYVLKPQLFVSQMHTANIDTPFHFYHGTRDLVVQCRRGEEAYDIVRKHHSLSRWRDYPVGHEVCLEELRQIRFWLHNRYTAARSGALNRQK